MNHGSVAFQVQVNADVDGGVVRGKKDAVGVHEVVANHHIVIADAHFTFETTTQFILGKRQHCQKLDLPGSLENHFAVQSPDRDGKRVAALGLYPADTRAGRLTSPASIAACDWVVLHFKVLTSP